jgi:uncharacterized damage-inducible protein DinB
MNATQLHKEIVTQGQLRFNENCLRIEKCLEYLTDEDMWFRSNPESNSIANLMLHLNGNIKQYVLGALGNENDERNRGLEFSRNKDMTKEELGEMLLKTCEASNEIIKKLTVQQLLEYHSVQGFKLSGFGILIHVVEHFSYHTGQIAAATKVLKGKDLGFYSGFDLNVKNIRN